MRADRPWAYDHDLATSLRELRRAEAIKRLGDFLSDGGKHEEARARYEEARALYSAALGEDHPRLAQLDLAWARLDRPGPWDALAGAGRLRPVVTPPDVERAGTEPPSDTRAWTRGRVVALAADRVTGAAWDWLQVRDAHGAERRVDLAEPLGHTRADVGGLADEAALARLLAGAGHDH